MVGWHLLLLLVVETAAYGTLARHLHIDRGWSLADAAALAVGIYVGVRAVLVGAEFLLTRWQGTPIPTALHVPWPRAASMYLRELGGWLLMFSLVLPFILSRRSVIDHPVQKPASRLPVLLVHGLACNRGNWFWFRRQLASRGHDAFAVDVTPPFSSINTYAPQLKLAIDEVLEATGCARLILIGHSMGGLVARAYIDQAGKDRVAHVITLGSPHFGTWMTRFALGPNLRNMDLGSRWLKALGEREAQHSPQPYANFTCLYTLHDNLVTPQTSAALPSAETIVLSGIGHLSLVLSSTVVAHVAAVLDRLDQGRTTDDESPKSGVAAQPVRPSGP